MAHPSPLRQDHLERNATLLPYGPPGTDVELAESFDDLELEYAALRKRCVLIDRPDRGVIEITGADRIGFLNRMVTQELAGLAAGGVRESFWLNRKGRIESDLLLMELGERMLADVDVHFAARTVQTLSAFVFSEDVSLSDATASHHRLELVGPTGPELLTIASGAPAPEPGTVARGAIAGESVVLDASDALGVPLIGVTCAAAAAASVAGALFMLGAPAGLERLGEAEGAISDGTPAGRIRLRRAGWHALNIARIEAGLPRFMLDFGPDSLPAETGLLDRRVSFTKGCYLGQEIVARMRSLGHPKRTLVAIECERRAVSPERHDPVHPSTGTPVCLPAPPGQTPAVVGAVTSAALSPSLGNLPVCFAQVKWGYHEPGTELMIQAEGVELSARVREGLRFVGRSGG
jgi:folate-binding protein YgfZ